jgi:tetraacyldisaccharide 4'-kinase
MKGYLYNLATDKYKGFIPNVLKLFLFLLSIIYGAIVRALIVFYQIRPYRLNCKVISVGNITLGGTGKTTLVECIARYLKNQGHKVAILTRGYKRKISNLKSQISNHELIGDEPYMLSQSLGDIPVIVDKNRIKGARLAIKDNNVDTVILDDGFQQWQIKKDLELVTIDATCPFGNRHMLPRGILREPLSSLRRADIFILTKTNLNTDIESLKHALNKLNPESLIVESIHHPIGLYDIKRPQELLKTEILKGKNVTLFSGIGNPDSFENLIKGLGINISLIFRFPDHYNYHRKDLDRIISSSKDKDVDTIVTTAKDAARISNFELVESNIRILVLRIALKIKDEERFYNRLLRLYSI